MSVILVVILGFSIALNCGYAAMCSWMARRYLPRFPFLPKLLWGWAIVMASLFILNMTAPYSWAHFMQAYLYFPLSVEMAWNLLFVQFLFLGIIPVVLVSRRWFPPEPPPATERGISRREFVRLTAVAAVPAAAITLGVHGTLTRDDLGVRELSIPITNLPPELEGFKIAHVSDLHSGNFVGPGRLKIISDLTNDQKADMVMITGDVINTRMEEFPAALACIQRMESRLGTYLCEGNHDVIPGLGLVRAACKENGLRMLGYESVVVPVEGGRLIIGSMPWIRKGFQGHPDLITKLYPERVAGDFRVLLAHHPNLYDIAESADLVLAGHTHGGQLMLTPELGLGPFFFHYWSGLYRKGNNALVVSNGAGDWFPCRIGAPAEIGLLKLTRAT